MVLLLQVLGHEAEFITDPRECLHAVRRIDPDILFLDIRMPSLDGYSVARIVREDCGRDRPRICAITGFNRPEDHALSRASGIDAHVAKPVSLEVVQSILAQLAE
jgi:CheY-like chemotaxis protein